MFQAYATATTTSFATTGLTVGNHQFSARVRARGYTNTFSSNTITVPLGAAVGLPCTAVALDAPPNGLLSALGALVALHATATCPAGTTPEFAYQIRRPGTTTWTAITGYGPATASFIPAGAGGWEISALVRAVGSTDAYQAQSAVTPMTVSETPMTTDDTLIIAEDHPGTVNVLANDSSPNGDTLTATIAAGPSGGTATITSAGVVTYRPRLNYNGSDALTYTAHDSHGNSENGTLHITITPVNDPPSADHDMLTLAEGSSGTIDPTLNDSDVDGDPLSVMMLSVPDHGTATRVGNLVTYTPAASYHGSDEFQYTVTDGHGGVSTASVFVTVTSVDDPPTAIDDALTVDEDTAGAIDVLTNDHDPEGETLTVVDFTQPLHGTVTMSGGTATYTPAANYHGNDAFTYTVSDGMGGTSTATVRITVTSVNDAPVAANDTATTNQDNAVAIAVLGNDSDADGDALTITAVTSPAHGTAAITGSTVTYSPALHYSGADAFGYTITDPSGATSTASVAITVTHTNTPPVAVDDRAAIDEDTATTIDVIANDSDPDGDALTVTAVTAPSHGTAVITDAHHITYTPAANYHGTDAFGYTVSDGQDTASATVALAIASVNDAPVAADDSATTAEDTAVAVSVLDNDSDLDGDTLTVVVVGTPGHGTATITETGTETGTGTGTGTITYTPAANYHGADAFSYVIDDGHGGTATASVSITITSVNDAPTAVDDLAMLAEDGSVIVDVTANDTDPDGDALTITAIGLAGHGLASLVDGQHLAYTPAPNYHGTDAVGYTISDGNGGTASATLLLAIASVNDAPVAVDDAATLDEDSSTTVDVVANDSDVDGDALTVVAILPPAHGTAAITDAHHLRYTPDANYHGPDAITYSISDGNGGLAMANLALTVTSVNDAPVAADDSATTDEDAAVTLDLVANDSDVDGDALTITAVTTAAHGAAVIADAHHVTYTPAANYHGPDGFSYTISDGAATASAAVALTITSVNDAPVAAPVAASTFNDTQVAISLAATDVDGDPLTYAITRAPAHGSLGLLAGNHVTYTPAPGFTGADGFAFTASDGTLSSAAAPVAITVNPSVCGNGAREGREECDDGNAVAGDGCEASCKLTCGAGTGADRATVDPSTGHCFAAYDGTTHSYQQAAAMCGGFGAHLPTLTSEGVDAAAFGAVHAGDAPWLGADDLATAGTFHWSTGEALGYSHVAAGSTGDCLRYQADGSWTGAACASTTGTLCEFDLASGTPSLASGGSGTRGVAIADLNGDGFADIAATNPASNTVGILLGNGAGGFTLAATYGVTNPSAIAAGDFDGDGHIDLAVANATASQLILLRGGPAGAFTVGSPLAIAAGATALVAADLDGDGVLDLVVGATGAVQLWHGTGTASFTLAGLVPVATPVALAAGDFNRDGHTDLAVTTASTVLVLRNTGTGALAAPTTIGSLGLGHGLIATDLDGDGNLDLAATHDLGSVAVWFGSAAGTFAAPVQLTVGGSLLQLSAGDFDGDGQADLAAIASGMATVLHGTGSGRAFTMGPSVATGGAGASAVVVGRLDADALDDLVIANPTTSTIGVVLGGGPVGKALPLALNATATSTVTADFNGDGVLDLAVSDPATAKIYIYLGVAGGGLVPTTPVTLIAGANPTAMAATDLNGDGVIDLAVLNTGFSSVGVVRGNGNGTFQAPFNVGTASSPRQFAFADFNGDGRPDIAVACANGNAVSLLLNTGPSFGRLADIAIASGPVSVTSADFNGDGKADLAVVAGDAAVRVMLGTGTAAFGAPIVVPLAAAASAVTAADVTGDGHADLVVTRPSTGHVSVLAGNGSGGFGAALDVAVGSGPASVITGDVDGDGHLDILVGNATSGDVSVLHNDAAGGFGASRIPAGGPATQLTLADLDGDGHADITVASGQAFVVTLVSPR